MASIQLDSKWYQHAAVYQIYPRSFHDSNGDGVGDLRGITEKLPYLADLGINAIWLSPFYPSPMADFGYDVSDYCDVDPIFGTLEDFDELIREAHSRNIKVLVDYIPNHSSDQHPWFIESRSSRDNPKRDWYIWKEPKLDGSTPNNWLSIFGGSGWEFDETTQSYYYHSFLKEQPDLNWHNPEVRAAMKDVLQFWLDRGVDGFRMDAVYFLGKDENLCDNPLNSDFQSGVMEPYNEHQNIYNQGMPCMFDILREFAELLEGYEDRFMITEVYLPVLDLLPFFDLSPAKIHSPFNMNLICLPWSVSEYRQHIEDFEHNLTPHDIPNYVLGNHDKPRVSTRLGQSQARLLAFMQLTLRGMPVIYYGEEIGMEDVTIPADAVQDPIEKRIPGFHLGRDPARTPMQWSSEPHAGFSDAFPWLPVSPDYMTHNVDRESTDPHSFLSMYKSLLRIRNASDALKRGAYRTIETDNPNVFAYIRESVKENAEKNMQKNMLVILNFSETAQEVSICAAEDMPEGTTGKMLCGTHLVSAGIAADTPLRKFTLRPHEGYLLETAFSGAAITLPEKQKDAEHDEFTVAGV